MTDVVLKKNRRRTPLSLGAATARLFANLISWAFSITCLFPIVWMVFSSLKTKKEFMTNVLGWPRTVSFHNYINILSDSSIGSFMLNTLRNTALSLLFIILFGFVNGYIFSRFRFRGRQLLFSLYMMGMLVPIHALLVPLYIQFSRAHLVDRWFTVSLASISFGLPMAIFLIESYIGTVPREIDEAAAIDGAGFTRTLFTIIMPLATPILITVGIISFFNCWNEFSFSLVLLNSRALYTLQLGLTLFKGLYETDYTRMMACMVIAMLPALVLYFIFSKNIIKGMMSGAIKG